MATSVSRSLSSAPTWLMAAALLAFWSAMRVLGGSGEEGSFGFEIFLTVAGLSFVVAFVLRLTAYGSAGEAKPFLQAWLVSAASVGIGAGLVFAWRDMTGPESTSTNGPVLLTLAVLLIVGGAATLFALQWAAAPMRQAGHVEGSRLGFAAMSAAIAVAALATLVGANYVAAQSKARVDLSFGAPTQPSNATLSLIRSAKAPVEVFLFFERGSPVITEVGDYFDALEAAGAKVTRLDHALDPKLATALKVSKNGSVGFRVGEQSDKWFLGEKRDQARRKLKKIDEEVATRLSKLTRDEKLLYFTVGHGERQERKAAKSGRPGSAGLMESAKTLNVKKKKLGLAEGLGNAVPDDADLVAILGPAAPFHESEVQALVDYVNRGGAMLITLDPGLDIGLAPLLAALGLKTAEGEVCNDKEYVVRTRTPADHNFIISASFTSHKSTSSLSATRGKAAVLFLGATALEKVGEDVKGRKVTMLARSRKGSFLDLNGNRQFEPNEKRTIHELAAAVELPKGEADLPGRAIVLADSEAFSDALLPNDANRAFAADVLRWLMRDDAAAGAIQTDDDVPILHTKDGDTAWFYGTTFVAPVSILVGGLLFVRYRRRRRKP